MYLPDVAFVGGIFYLNGVAMDEMPAWLFGPEAALDYAERRKQSKREPVAK